MYIIKILMPFDVLVDTDIGLWNLISKDYRNETFFLPGMLDLSDTHKKYFSIIREDRNPILLLLSEPDKNLADDFYAQFIEKEYNNILELSPNTDVGKVLKVLMKTKSNVIRLTILCKNNDEKMYIESMNGIAYDSVIIGDLSTMSLSDYGTIFVKDINDLDKFRHIEGKTIYIPNYGFNILMDPDKVNPILPLDILEKYAGENEFFIYSVYNINPRDIPKG